MDLIKRIQDSAYKTWSFLEAGSERIPVEGIKRANKRSGELAFRLLRESLQIMIAPTIHWNAINRSERGHARELKLAVLFGIFLVFVASFVGYIIFDSLYGINLTDALQTALNAFLILSLHLIGFVPIIFFVTKYLFKSKYPVERAFRLVIYSILPAILVMFIVGFFPFLEPLKILAYYSFYLLYTGIQVLYKIEGERKLHYSVLSIAILLISSILIQMAVTKVLSLIFE